MRSLLRHLRARQEGGIAPYVLGAASFILFFVALFGLTDLLRVSATHHQAAAALDIALRGAARCIDYQAWVEESQVRFDSAAAATVFTHLLQQNLYLDEGWEPLHRGGLVGGRVGAELTVAGSVQAPTGMSVSGTLTVPVRLHFLTPFQREVTLILRGSSAVPPG